MEFINEIDLMLACARVHVDSATEQRIIKTAGEIKDWKRFVQLCIHHKVLPLVFQNLVLSGCHFFPENLKDNPNIPSIVITGFQISNEHVDFDTAISEKKVINLNYTQTDLSFDFVALDYIFPEKNQYKYQLVGYDNDNFMADN